MNFVRFNNGTADACTGKIEGMPMCCCDAGKATGRCVNGYGVASYKCLQLLFCRCALVNRWVEVKYIIEEFMSLFFYLR